MITHWEIKKKELVLFFFFLIFIYLAATGLSCDRQDLLLQCTDSLVTVCGLSNCNMPADCYTACGILVSPPGFPGGSVGKGSVCHTGDM